jgi:hypothetical protein
MRCCSTKLPQAPLDAVIVKIKFDMVVGPLSEIDRAKASMAM